MPARDLAIEDSLTQTVREALAAGAWRRAFDLLLEAREAGGLTDAQLDLLGDAAYGAGDLEAAIAAWEELHRRHSAAGDTLAAAGAAVTIATYLMMDTGLMAPVRGWTARAERLLDGQAESPVHAGLAMVRAYERLLSGDVAGTRLWAEAAVDLGTRLDAAAPAAVGRVALARTMIFDGQVEDGLRLLDEAAVATLSGSLDPLAAGMVWCELICAMQGLAQYDRAEEWTDAMERWRHGNAFGGLNGRCRVHRAEILRLRGSCAEAEHEALLACEELRPWMRREFGWPLTELGTIRLRRGDLAGAERAFLEAHGHGWDPHPGLALLRLAQGDVTSASVLIRAALEHPGNVPSKERPPYGPLPRAPSLAAEVEIALAAGEPDRAARAAEELTGIAGAFRSRALEAAAALARGRVALARGDAEAAVGEGETALAGWCDVGAPYEAAVVRGFLAEAYGECGNHARARLEAQAATAAFTRIGAVPPGGPPAVGGHATSAAMPLAVRHDDPVVDDAVAVFRREGDTRRIVFAGRAVLLHDLKGMRHLERLLAEPGREFHALDLVTAEVGASTPSPANEPALRPSRGGDAGPLLDEQARQAYRRRLAEIDDDLADAERFGDAERAARAEADREYLVRELARAFGLGGRSRTAGAAAERARASVTRALRYALVRIATHHRDLGEHLQHTVHTGTYCCYRPDPRVPVDWQL